MPSEVGESADARARLLDLIHGYRATSIVVTAVDLGLVDALRDGPVSVEDLARRLGAHESALRRFLRAMHQLRLLESSAGMVALTRMGSLLADPEAGMRERAVLAGAEYVPAWQALRHSVLTGRSAFDHVFGIGAWEHRRRDPLLNDCLNRTMADDQARTGRALATAFDFSACRLVVDVGGGQGALLAEILAQWPQPDGLLFDQPHVVAGATTILTAAGVWQRCRIEAGSFFDSVPAGGDAYILQHVLHNWDDERCGEILRHCRAAMPPEGMLLVVENVLPEDGEPDARLTMLDLHMLAMLGGRERTRTEYDALLRAAGFARIRAVPTCAGTELLVARLATP